MSTNNPASAAKPGSISEYRAFKRRWNGDPKIIVGIDIGTIDSKVAFTCTFLEKGLHLSSNNIVVFRAEVVIVNTSTLVD